MSVAAGDAPLFRAVARQSLERECRHVHIPRLFDVSIGGEIGHVAAAILAETPVAASVLGEELQRVWPQENPSTLVSIARCSLAVAQVPPRGTWRVSAPIAYRLLSDQSETGRDPILDITVRYLRSFGPSTRTAIQTWLGITGLGALLSGAVESGELSALTGPTGVDLYDAFDGVIVDGRAPTPPRLIAPFDHLVVSHADRTRVIDRDVYASISPKNAVFPGFVLVGGRVVGTWKFGIARGGYRTVRVELLLGVTPKLLRAVEQQREALESFANIAPL